MNLRQPSVRTEDPAEYSVSKPDQSDEANRSDEAILTHARLILFRRLMIATISLSTPEAVKDYLSFDLCEHEHEVFGVLWLDAQNSLIKDDRMFRGTLTQASVYPREIAKAALANNAAAAILYHNHPSGRVEPSKADELLTKSLKQTLDLVDCRVLDHIIVAKLNTMSFAERGLI